jgi:hypothetical protein
MNKAQSRRIEARNLFRVARIRISRSYLVSMAGLLLALVLLLGHSLYSEYILVICVLFAVIFFGLISLNLRIMRRSREEVPPFDVDQPSANVFRTFTGALRKGEAKLQLMIIPVAVVAGFLVLAAVDLWDRAHVV